MKKLDIKHYLFYTLRGRLVVSITAVITIVMSAFVTDLLLNQRKVLLKQQAEHAIALSQPLSITAAGWLSSYDIAGLQELADAQKSYPELSFAILTDKRGHILAHTDHSKNGHYLLDLPHKPEVTILSQSSELIDIAVPSFLNKQQVGWVRLGLNQKLVTDQMNGLFKEAILYIIIAILAGAAVIWFMGYRLTRRLYAVHETIQKIGAGNSSARTQLKGYDEAAQLSREFNKMLDALDERNAALRESETGFEKLFNVAAIPLVFLNSEGDVLNYNDAFFKTFGYSRDEVPTIREWWKQAYPDPVYRHAIMTQWDSLVQSAIREHIDIPPLEVNVVCKNKDVRTVMISGSVISNNLLAALYDITDRKRAEEQLKESFDRLQKIAARVPGVIYQLKLLPDGNFYFPYASEAIKDLCGVTPDEVKLSAAKAFQSIHPDDYDDVIKSIRESSEKLTVWQHEYRLKFNDGTIRTLYGNALPQREADGSVLWYGFISDITNKKVVEEQLHVSQEITRTIIDTVPVRVFWKDRNSVYMGCNEMFANDAGFHNPDEVIGKDDFGMGWHVHAELYRNVDRLVIESGVPQLNIEEQVQLPDGSQLSILTSKTPLRDSKNEIIGVLGAYTDITDRKLAETAIRKTNRLYLFVSHINQMIIQAKDEMTLLREACRIAVDYGEFKMAWIGQADKEKATVIPVVSNGEENGYLSEIRAISILEKPEGKGPTGTAFRDEKVAVINDIANDPRMIPWRESALKRGYSSCIALPLKKYDSVYGVFSLYASVPDFFNIDEIQLLEGVINNLSFALDKIDNEKQRKIAEKRVEDYIFALNESSIVDVSDNKGIIQYANENFCKISGYTLDELIGQDHKILKSGYHTEEHYSKLWSTILRGKVWRSEVKNKAKDGSYFWVDTTIIPFLNENHEPVQFITIRSDITKRKEVEASITDALERYDLLTRATSDTIWDMNAKTQKVLYNQGITRTFGYQTPDLGEDEKWWEEHLHPEDKEHVMKIIDKSITQKDQFIQLEYRFMCADDTYKYVQDRMFVIYDQAGNPERMIGSMQDVTTEKELAIKIEKEVIEAQEREWNQIGMELHDNVNQVLAASLLFMGYGLEKMKKGELPENEIKEGEKYVREAINEIRKLSHQLSPGATKNVSLMHVVTSLVETMTESNQFHVKFEVNGIDDREISDKLQLNLYRILQEQLSNIIKHADAKEVIITLRKEGRKLLLKIVDDGNGFDPEKQMKGIGLENIRRRVKAFAGELKLHSAPGKGCEIAVEIPL
ncbi:MAG: PAS domain S-box protein [Lacibacter sp.]